MSDRHRHNLLKGTVKHSPVLMNYQGRDVIDHSLSGSFPGNKPHGGAVDKTHAILNILNRFEDEESKFQALVALRERPFFYNGNGEPKYRDVILNSTELCEKLDSIKLSDDGRADDRLAYLRHLALESSAILSKNGKSAVLEKNEFHLSHADTLLAQRLFNLDEDGREL